MESQTVQVAYVDDYCRTAENLIEGAHRQIRVALFLMRFSEKNQCPENLVRDLVEAKRRGVNVVVFLEEDNYNLAAERYLKENNVPVYHTKRFLHAKVLQVDDCFIVGSHNWTWNAMHKNIEASVLVCRSNVIDAFFRKVEGFLRRG